MKQINPNELLGQEITLPINNLSHQGEGVGRSEGIAVFVPGSLPGEKVKARVTAVKKNFIRAQLLEIIEPSSQRRTPDCPQVEYCGGCSLQHLDYQAQLNFKTLMVKETLKRIGGLPEVEVKPTIGMVEPWRYRNKAQFHVQTKDEPPEVRIGYYLPGSRKLLEVDDCRLMPAAWRELLQKIKMELLQLWQRLKLEEKAFPLHHLLLRSSFSGRETALLLVVRYNTEPLWKEWVEEFLRRLPAGIAQVAENVNPYPEKTVLGKETRVLHGPARLREKLGGLDLMLSPASFYQVNPVQTEMLYHHVLEYAGLTGTERVFDLYCGVGAISLLLAGRAQQVVGIDTLREAVNDAKDNARLNNIQNADFYRTDVKDYLLKFINEKQPAPEVVVLDPPRQGGEPGVMELIARLNTQRIVYVSCNPSTLARDLRCLAENGYQVTEVQPVDMFPQTSHTEIVTLLTREVK